MVQKAKVNKLESAKIKTQFLAEVDFGMPSKECRNYGICRIHPIRWEEVIETKKSLAIVTLTDDHHLDLDFLKSFLSACKYESFLSGEEFLVEEDYHFYSPENQDFSFKIPKGLYPVQERAGMVTVRFFSPPI